MKIIKNKQELQALLNEYKDLILPNDDVRIEYQVDDGDLRNVECCNLFLTNDKEKFNFNGWNFNGWNFNGWDFNGHDFNGWNFNGNNFNGDNFNGNNFNGKKVSYWAFFNCSGFMKCESYEGRRLRHAEPITLDGKIEIIKSTDVEVENAIKLLTEKGLLKDGKILTN